MSYIFIESILDDILIYLTVTRDVVSRVSQNYLMIHMSQPRQSDAFLQPRRSLRPYPPVLKVQFFNSFSSDFNQTGTKTFENPTPKLKGHRSHVAIQPNPITVLHGPGTAEPKTIKS